MRGELRKVLCTRWSAALLAALVALNGVLFYRYCTQPQGDEDYTLPQLRAAYARSDAELQADYDAQWARLDAAEPLTDEVYDEIYLAMSLDEAVLTQRETVRSYPDYVRSLREEAEAKQRSGFFGAPDSFAGRSLRRAAAHYAHLEVLAPEPSFSGGITVLTDWRVTDGICAAGGAMAGLLLLTGEQAAGLLCLVRPTKNGRGALFRRKFAAMVAELAGLFVLTYGGNLAISAAVLGLGDLRRPVQAVIGLQGCPLPLTAGEDLLGGDGLFPALCVHRPRGAGARQRVCRRCAGTCDAEGPCALAAEPEPDAPCVDGRVFEGLRLFESVQPAGQQVPCGAGVLRRGDLGRICRRARRFLPQERRSVGEKPRGASAAAVRSAHGAAAARGV